jgi:hypothetical protein
MHRLKQIASKLLLAFTLLNLPLLIGATQKPADEQRSVQGNPETKVWVNTHSGVYHCPGTRWYGNTKSGEYMTQKQAQEKKYRPAHGKVCQ